MSDSIGSVSVDVVPDARGWSEKLRAQLRDQSVTINADADTTEAETQLDEAARTRTARIKTSVDKNAIQQVDSFFGKLGLLPALAIAAGSALVPLGGALAGVAAGLAAPLAIAGGGATLFAFLGGLAIKDTQQKLKDINELDTKLSGLTKGTQEYRDVQAQLKVAQDALSPAQERFATSLGHLKGTFSELLQGKTGQALLGPFTQGMNLLSQVLPTVAPLIQSVSGAFSSLLGDLARGAGTKGFSDFVGQMSRLARPDIVSLGHILGNITGGIAGLVVQFDKHIGHGLLDSLDQMTGAFRDFGANSGNSKGLQSFFDYFHKVGPQVGDTNGAVARAIGHIATALAPLGPPVLHIIEGIADAISAIPTPVLTSLAAAVGSLVVLQKTGGLKLAGNLLGGRGLTSSGGLLGGVIGSARPVPVFVTNPGFGGPGGGPGGLGKFGKYTPAVGAGEVVGGAAAVGLLAYGGYEGQKLTRQNTQSAFSSYGMQHAAPTLGGDNRPFRNLPADGIQLNTGGIPLAQAIKLAPAVGRAGTAFDALRAHAATASRAIDQIGPHAQSAAGTAIHAVAVFQNKLDSIHDKKIRIIAETASAIANMQRLQAMQIADKHFTVYQRNQIIERAVGPGGGIGRNTGLGGGVGSGGVSGGGAGRTNVHVHLDDNGRATLSGYMDDNYQRNAQADRAYDAARAGR